MLREKVREPVMRRYLAAMVMSLLLATAAGENLHANETTLSPNEILSLLLQDGELSRSQRNHVAESFSNFCHGLNRKIPALSPKEQDWLESEIETGRASSLVGTVEFAKWQAKRTLSECVYTAQLLEDAIATNNSKNEIYKWTMLIIPLLDGSILNDINILKSTSRARITDKERTIVGMFKIFAKLIVEKILAPRLRPNP